LLDRLLCEFFPEKGQFFVKIPSAVGGDWRGEEMHMTAACDVQQSGEAGGAG
jgi:hypothetical protein